MRIAELVKSVEYVVDGAGNKKAVENFIDHLKG